MQQIDGFRKHGKMRALRRRKFDPAGSFLKRLLETGETFVPEGNSCNRFLVHGASLPQSDSCLEYNQTDFRVKPEIANHDQPASILGQPTIQVLGNELIVIQKRIGRVDPFDLLQLSLGKYFGWLQAPAASQQPLPAQYFVDAGNAAVKLVPGIKNRGVCVRNLRAPGEEIVNAGTILFCFPDRVEEFNGAARPHGPLTKQAAHKVRGAISKAKL